MARLQSEAEADRARPPAEIRAKEGRAMITGINGQVLDLFQKFHLIPVIPQDDTETKCVAIAALNSSSVQFLLSDGYVKAPLKVSCQRVRALSGASEQLGYVLGSVIINSI